jgi:AcrR family transcriptional regulator
MGEDGTRTNARTTERRDEIAAACLRDIADLGFAQVTLASIARRVGLPGRDIHAYFDSRDELIEYAIADEVSRILGEMSVLFDGGRDARGAVVETFAYVYRRMRDHPVMHHLLTAERARLMAHLRGDTPETLLVVQAVVADELRLLAHRTSSPIDAETGAEFMVRLWLSLLVSPHLGADLSEPGVVEDTARRWLLAGMFQH